MGDVLRRLFSNDPHPIVGAWYVDAVAPYRPHLFTFLPTGTDVGVVFSTNPTNVQDGPGASVPVTDSVGMGHWKIHHGYVLGTMWQENALQPARVRGPRLAVSFRLRVQNPKYGGHDFSGPATAELIDPATGKIIESQESYLVGSRLAIRPAAAKL